MNKNKFNNDNRNHNNHNFDRNNSRPGNFGNRNNFNQNGGKFDKNRQGGNQRFGGSRPLDEKGIDKNIKNIMTTEIVEKENQRDYSSKVLDKQKASRQYDEAKATKKVNKSRRNNQFDEFDSGKLK